MPASALATVATLQMVFFREHNITIFAQIVIFLVKLIGKSHRCELRINTNVQIRELFLLRQNYSFQDDEQRSNFGR